MPSILLIRRKLPCSRLVLLGWSGLFEITNLVDYLWADFKDQAGKPPISTLYHTSSLFFENEDPFQY